MNIAGIDYSTHAIDLVTIPHDQDGQPVWYRYDLEGDNAFERTRDIGIALPGRSSAFWDDILAVGIEHPAGHYGVGPMLRLQGAILTCIPARMLVEPLPPAKWRKLVGLAGNASKDQVATHSAKLLATWRIGINWPQDAYDAHMIAQATNTLISNTVSS